MEKRLQVGVKEFTLKYRIGRFNYSFESKRPICKSEGIEYVQAKGNMPVEVYAELTIAERFKNAVGSKEEWQNIELGYFYGLNIDGTYIKLDSGVTLENFRRRTMKAIDNSPWNDNENKNIVPELEVMIGDAFPNVNFGLNVCINCPDLYDVNIKLACSPWTDTANVLCRQDVFRELCKDITAYMIQEGLRRDLG